MAESKKVVIVGIAGVGKTTVVSKVVEILQVKNKSVNVCSFGTIMLEEAKKKGVENRDELRKLSVSEQKTLQSIAARRIAETGEDIVIIDTHSFISTKAGFYPGLPHHVLEIIKPANFIMISARPEEIYNRRMKDGTRNRDKISIEAIKKELDISNAMLSSCSVLSGSPMRIVLNSEGKVEEVADTIVSAIGQ
ncbi:MAG: adenylate kinase [Nitrosopumilaceae archaeon]